MSMHAAFSEVMGKESGSNRGRGGSKHLSDPSLGVVPCNAIVAGHVPIACGLAWALKLDGRTDIAVAVFGDGALNQGVIHEAFNLAAVFDIPILFVCENNLYAEMTPISDMVGVDSLTERAHGHGIPTQVVDGMDVEAIRSSTAEALAEMRNGGGPVFLEAQTYRFCGHMPTDRQSYRTEEEVERWRKRDPVELSFLRLRDLGLDEMALASISTEVESELKDAERLAMEAVSPDEESIWDGTPDWTSTGAGALGT
jgi:TPP-dependent pyruvate/acetoin dehydrogenase alpha subunit